MIFTILVLAPFSPPSASRSLGLPSSISSVLCILTPKDGARYTEGEQLQFYGQDMQGRDLWVSCVVVTVNAHAKEVQYNQRTGKPEHYGSYLIHVGEPGAPDPMPMDLIYEQQLRVSPKKKSWYTKLGL